MTDLAQGADLAAYCLIAFGVVEELERPLFIFDVVAHPVDLRKPALPEYVQDLEAVVDDVADSIVSGLDAQPTLAVLLRRAAAVTGCHVGSVWRLARPRPGPCEDPPGA